MEFYDAVYRIAKKKGITIEKISLSLGKTSGFITAQKSRGSKPRIDTAAKILDACGYILCAIPEDEVPNWVIEIDGPVVE